MQKKKKKKKYTQNQTSQNALSGQGSQKSTPTLLDSSKRSRRVYSILSIGMTKSSANNERYKTAYNPHSLKRMIVYYFLVIIIIIIIITPAIPTSITAYAVTASNKNSTTTTSTTNNDNNNNNNIFYYYYYYYYYLRGRREMICKSECKNTSPNVIEMWV